MERFMDSVNKQKYQQFHLVFIDDNSDDGSAEFVR